MASLIRVWKWEYKDFVFDWLFLLIRGGASRLDKLQVVCCAARGEPEKKILKLSIIRFAFFHSFTLKVKILC